VLICSSPKFSNSADWPGIKTKVLDFFTQQQALDFTRTLQRFLLIQAMGSVNAKQDTKTIKQVVQQFPLPSPIALSAGLDMLQNIDLHEQFKILLIPCHIFLSRLDTLVPDKLAPQMQYLNSKVTLEVISDASHAPFISDTEFYAKRLIKVLI
jgi:pimeloyl-[acyl-carrier protein] methyl ester esterase